MKKVFILLFFMLGLSSLGHAGVYGGSDFNAKRSTSITTPQNHTILSTGCIYVDFIVVESTRSGVEFGVWDSSTTSPAIASSTTFKVSLGTYTASERTEIRIQRNMEYGLMINTRMVDGTTFGGTAGGHFNILYDFTGYTCYDRGSRLDQ